MSDLRAAVIDELACDPDALDQIEHDLFDFIDMLAADREASVRRRAMAATLVPRSSAVSGASPSAE